VLQQKVGPACLKNQQGRTQEVASSHAAWGCSKRRCLCESGTAMPLAETQLFPPFAMAQSLPSLPQTRQTHQNCGRSVETTKIQWQTRHLQCSIHRAAAVTRARRVRAGSGRR